MIQDWDSGAISDFHLERFALGELPAPLVRKLEERLSVDASLRERLETVRAHEHGFRLAFPAAEFVPRIKAAAAQASKPVARSGPSLLKRVSRGLRAAPAWQLAGACALLLLAAAPLLLRGPSVATEDTRLKGAQPELRLYRNTPTGPERLASGSAASAGDVVQIEFHPGDYPYGAIVSVDGAGSVTLHWPMDARAGTNLSAFHEYRLPKAFRLDAAPKFERFHLLLSREPIDVEAMLKLVAASAGRDTGWLASQVPAAMRVAGFTLVK